MVCPRILESFEIKFCATLIFLLYEFQIQAKGKAMARGDTY
jgi:hypothetical protein